MRVRRRRRCIGTDGEEMEKGGCLVQTQAAGRRAERREGGSGGLRGLVQNQAGGSNIIAVRTRGAWRKERDGRNNSRVS